MVTKSEWKQRLLPPQNGQSLAAAAARASFCRLLPKKNVDANMKMKKLDAAMHSHSHAAAQGTTTDATESSRVAAGRRRRYDGRRRRARGPS
ncbi:unnamed protein product [Heligmosomoides polygyrus]|uniref:Uncharacterized protein n=1 Tax=Heligmosomoides polygyrus TaxID=6339 RepID=A0A183FGL8_HELPZ|nr:unnamed protein product [Heligmosomoides polygyrus]